MEGEESVALDLSMPKTGYKSPSRSTPPLVHADQQHNDVIDDVTDSTRHMVSAEPTSRQGYGSCGREMKTERDEHDTHPPSPKRHKSTESIKEECETNHLSTSHALADRSLARTSNSLVKTERSLALAANIPSMTNRSLGLADSSLAATESSLDLEESSLGLTESNLGLTKSSLGLADDSLAVTESSLGLGVSQGAIWRTVDGVTVGLHDETLWHAFSDCGTEMIISRGGRRMFPHIVLSFSGLAPDHVYNISLEIAPADDRRYKYINNTWMAMGMADPGPALQPITHPDSPNTGAYWAHNRASFSKVRLTNNKEASCSDSSDGNVLLLSMHKYVAVIKVRDVTPGAGEAPPRLYCFDETTFMAVTAYQNYKITHLKIKNNPFAKAFRDFQNSSRDTRKAPRRKEAAKYHSSSSRDASSQRPLSAPVLPPAPTCFNPALYYPFPHLGGVRGAYRPDSVVPGLPGLPDPLTARGVNQAVMNRMAYFPWMAIGERMNDLWLKNHQRLFGLACPRPDSPPRDKDSPEYEVCEERDSGTERDSSPTHILNSCSQSAALKEEPGTAECFYS